MKKLDTEKLVAITYENMQRQKLRHEARMSAEGQAAWITYCSTDKAVEHILAMGNEIVRLNMEIDKLKRDHK